MTRRLFTTGAFIVPVEISEGNWVWMVSRFEDDTFDEDGSYVDVEEESSTEDGLVNEEEE